MNETDAKPARPPEVSLPSFGSRITRLRDRQGWSCRFLARRTGLHPERLRRLERGVRRPYLDEATRLASELGVSLDALVFGTGLEAPKAPDAAAETGQGSPS
jgi:transcriptional regulator with XRE-family HTH domain